MKNILCALVILCLSATPCLAGMHTKKEVKNGNLLYNKGRFEEALKQYEEALAGSPDSDIVNFNLGAALYKTEDYERAIGHFEKSLLSEDESLEQMANYNIGNAKYKYGITKEGMGLPMAVGLLKQSLHHFEHSLELGPDDEDAEYNYEFVKKELEHLEKKLEQEQQESKSQEEKKEDESEEQDAQQQQEQQGQQQEEEEKEKQSSVEQKHSGEKEADKEEAREEQQSETRGPQEEKEGKEEQTHQQMPESQEPTDGMPEEEALIILDSYRQEEEPKGLYKEKIPLQGMPEVLKDW